MVQGSLHKVVMLKVGALNLYLLGRKVLVKKTIQV